MFFGKSGVIAIRTVFAKRAKMTSQTFPKEYDKNYCFFFTSEMLEIYNASENVWTLSLSLEIAP